MLAGLSFIDVGEHEHGDSEVEGAVSEVYAVPEKVPAAQEKVCNVNGNGKAGNGRRRAMF